MKVKMIVTAIAVAGLTATSVNAADNGKLQLQINQLRAQQAQLQQQVANLQGQGQTTSAVHVGSIGDSLISANEYNNRGLDLLKSLAKAGSNAPLLTIGGTLEADGQYSHQGSVGSGATSGSPAKAQYTNSSASGFYLDTARIDVLAHVNDWINGEMSYDLNHVNNSALNTGSLLIGNLNQLPVYGQIGKLYPDAGLFGLSDNDIYSDNLVKNYFRPDAADGASVGFYKAGLHTSLTAFKTNTTPDNINNPNQATSNWSAQADYTFNTGQIRTTVGAGYVSNMVNTNSNLTISGVDQNTGRIPMASINAKVSFGPFDILGIYGQSLESVNNRTGSGTTELKAFDIETAYHLQVIKPTTVMLGYSRTYGFDTANVTDTNSAAGPKRGQWLLSVNSEVFKNTTVGLEYAHVGQFTNAAVSGDISHYDVLTADMTVKF
ncbi:LbtU family siderophore porin [Piscirickettsia litoralis]|uniref:Porin n=1 Tax=Piscirickettsia litoralis TaxID=1891921 RepID=A0ABX2ZZ21_9GAMM|nr:LbtU family siderophore porin [Piscirickettsia litoralis]ODN41478.1 hypothetical protein BGC07_15295 [Piscirickettsia litoralis]